jgi:CubicO group peptidase (beta-lactamase class C family)
MAAARNRIIPLILTFCCVPAMAQLAPETTQQVDAIVNKVLADTGEASLSIAIVKDGKLAYAQAYGAARLEPRVAATPDMRYKIGSNSKQFLAVTALKLAEEGKLSLDDKVARFFPQLTRARDITLRQLLSHTAGYSDYYAIDYISPALASATTPDAIIAQWGRQPLNFAPGQRWEYSNTNYVIAGRMLEKASGQALDALIRSRILDKVGMRSAIDLNTSGWGEGEVTGYGRYALGPLRPAQPEGRNWVWGAGQLAMSASDLARWDIALMDGTLLKPASRAALVTEARLANGQGTGYALGLQVDRTPDGRERWQHSGGMAGFISRNAMYPADGMAVVVLSNGPGPATAAATTQLEKLMLELPKPAAAPTAQDAAADVSLARVRTLFAQLQAGRPDRSLMTADLNAYFTDAVLADFAASLAPLGDVAEIQAGFTEERGGMVYRGYRVVAAGRKLRISTYFTKDGLLDQYLVFAR